MTAVVAAIRQDSDRRTRIAINTAIGKGVGAATIGSVVGLISAFGAASTGTAIASLSGAAATTAQLYWVGSIFGMGVAAGGAVLAATGVGAGLAAAYAGRRWLLGKVRPDDDLQEHERVIVVTCVQLISAIRAQIETGAEPSPAEMKVFSEQALLPLAAQIKQHWSLESLAAEEKSACRPFKDILAPKHLWSLDRAQKEIVRFAVAASRASAEAQPS